VFIAPGWLVLLFVTFTEFGCLDALEILSSEEEDNDGDDDLLDVLHLSINC